MNTTNMHSSNSFLKAVTSLHRLLDGHVEKT